MPRSGYSVTPLVRKLGIEAGDTVTTITEDVIRDITPPLGFVDVKVCTINETWSGLKRVVRKVLR